ncbi:MAG: hypothetical protein KDD70_08935 [Bdellovibrionales bacterium]|nr:hypothetical protein [Bdellovibrionales bacterium]
MSSCDVDQNRRVTDRLDTLEASEITFLPALEREGIQFRFFRALPGEHIELRADTEEKAFDPIAGYSWREALALAEKAGHIKRLDEAGPSGGPVYEKLKHFPITDKYPEFLPVLVAADEQAKLACHDLNSEEGRRGFATDVLAREQRRFKEQSGLPVLDEALEGMVEKVLPYIEARLRGDYLEESAAGSQMLHGLERVLVNSGTVAPNSVVQSYTMAGSIAQTVKHQVLRTTRGTK